MVDFSRPLVDAAGNDHAAINKAFQLGMIFWNFGVVAETGDDKFIREQLSTMEAESSRTDANVREFRAIVVMMFDRYATMRPAARPNLKRIIEGMWGADLSSTVPKLGWAGQIAGAAKKILSRESPDGEKGARE
jgi:hypothetical protein